MQLLSQLYSQAPAHNTVSSIAPLTHLLPRLWPCFRHTLSTVRSAAVRCLAALTQASTAQGQPFWLHNGGLLLTALRLAFENLLLEEDLGILQASQRLWSELLLAAAPAQLATIDQPCLEVGCFA